MIHTPHYCDNGTFLIYIDSYENELVEGHYYHSNREEMGYFRCLTQLFCRIEEILDSKNTPQSFQVKRKFSENHSVYRRELSDGVIPLGKLATFEIRILFRRNSSWQGTLIWLKEGSSQSFRSVLELMFLLKNALENIEDTGGKVAT